MEKANIQIHVVTHFVEEQSDPENERYVFSYTITISNLGTASAQLLRRQWLITDANGKKMSVEGEGVVGEQPHLSPGAQYTYTSGTVIETPMGVMQGRYSMVDESGCEFETEISPFRLAIPNIIH
ncbi:Co2+/Mg2+ efflux protein ApaG [Parasalinivibrio latis]|uniref:Co2+/Mg2+ efflux protein ApaG n=1 Tax=Parasalinivibrio latis TaxID=2952610 RepID=UPI0030E15D4F